jgi:type II secretory pathway pseudopilin PulG
MRREGRGTRRRGSAGFTMVALVIGMLILTITIAAVGPALGMIGRREREQELMFRGKQYARAISLFQRRYGRYPNTLKELYENNPRTIRKLWKDPMCDCSDWYLLILNSPDANPLTGMGVPAALAPPGRLRTPTPTPTPAGSFGTPQAAGPIVGVRSKVHKEALTAWRGQTYYDQWRFIVGDADREGTGAFDPNSLRRPPGQPPPPPPVR